MKGRLEKVALFFVLFVFLSLFLSCKGETPVVNAKPTVPTLEAFQRELSRVVDKVSPSVVTIFAVKEVSVNPFEHFDIPFDIPFEPFRRQERSIGSGVIVKYEDGKFYILTNNHVVEGAKRIRVSFDKHTAKKARIVGTDPKTDIAVLEVSAEGIENPQSRVAVLGDSDKVKVGQIVIAIGNPYGLERTVTMGVVSALKRTIGVTQYESFIQTDAAINPGNSGGPLINIYGEVIGINTAIVATGQGLGFAIPINLAKWVMDQILEKGKVIRGWLGVVIQDITPDIAEAIDVREGVLIAQVMPGSPADKAGLEAGDIVIEVDGKKIREARELQFTIMKTPPGTKVKLKILRNGKEKVITVKVGEFPENVGPRSGEMSEEDLGLSLRDMSEREVRRFGFEGVVVTGVLPGSPAGRAGLRPGDVIIKVNNIRVRNVREFYKVIDDLKKAGRSKALLLVRRGSANLFLTMDLR